MGRDEQRWADVHDAWRRQARRRCHDDDDDDPSMKDAIEVKMKRR